MRDGADRDALIEKLKADGVMAPFHYVPLHSAPLSLRYARAHGDMSNTDLVSRRLLRLPLFESLGTEQEFVIDRVLAHLGSNK